MKIGRVTLVLFLITFLTTCLKKVEPIPDQFALEVQSIDTKLAKDTVNYITYHSSGIRLAIHEFGHGLIPHSGQSVKVKYVGRLFSDTSIIVDSSTYIGFLDKLPISGLVKGVSLLPQGTKAALYIPSLYGYGSTGNSKVPANSILIYEVELLSVTMSGIEQIQFNKDTAAIHKYLTNKNITNAILHSTGIWYTIDTIGTGDSPRVYSKITATYKGSLMSNDYVFDQGTLTNQALFSLIDGFKIGIPLINNGATATLYIPSGLAYGNASTGGIPSNSNLIFKVTLTSFIK